ETSLRKLGVKDAFAPQTADYSGALRSEEEKLFLQLSAHKPVFELNESGITAAQLDIQYLRAFHRSLCVKSVTQPPPPTSRPPTTGFAAPTVPGRFAADRPFLFLIRHNPTGVLLFIGQVRHPSGY